MFILPRKFSALALNTAREIFRQPIVVILTVSCLATIGLLPVVTVFSLGQEERIVRDGAVAAVFIYGLFLVAASARASIAGQIRSGAAAGVLAKPVRRELFLGATLGGIIFALAVFTALGITGAMLSARMAVMGIITDWRVGIIYAFAGLLALGLAAAANYRGRNFCSALFKTLLICLPAALLAAAFLSPAGNVWPGGEAVHQHVLPGSAGLAGPVRSAGAAPAEFICWRLLPAGGLILLALAMLAAIALALSIRFKPVVVLFCCGLVFGLGLISDYLFHTLAGGGAWAEICSAILPDWQSLGIYAVLDETAGAAGQYLWPAARYALLYISAVLCLGFLSFRAAEV